MSRAMQGNILGLALVDLPAGLVSMLASDTAEHAGTQITAHAQSAISFTHTAHQRPRTAEAWIT
eukprot:3934813-Rhodomonas_salina.5